MGSPIPGARAIYLILLAVSVGCPNFEDFYLQYHRLADLAGAFALWAVSSEARLLHRKMVWAHWDVTELKKMDQWSVASVTYTGATITCVRSLNLNLVFNE